MLRRGGSTTARHSIARIEPKAQDGTAVCTSRRHSSFVDTTGNGRDLPYPPHHGLQSIALPPSHHRTFRGSYVTSECQALAPGDNRAPEISASFVHTRSVKKYNMHTPHHPCFCFKVVTMNLHRSSTRTASTAIAGACATTAVNWGSLEPSLLKNCHTHQSKRSDDLPPPQGVPHHLPASEQVTAQQTAQSAAPTNASPRESVSTAPPKRGGRFKGKRPRHKFCRTLKRGANNQKDSATFKAAAA